MPDVENTSVCPKAPDASGPIQVNNHDDEEDDEIHADEGPPAPKEAFEEKLDDLERRDSVAPLEDAGMVDLEHAQYNADERSRHRLDWIACFQYAMKAWFQVAFLSIPRLGVTFLFLCMYYIPSRIMTKETLQDIIPIVYENGRNILAVSSFWVAMVLILIEIFGFHFTLNPVLYSFLPTSAVHFALGYVFSKDPFFFNFFINGTTGFGIPFGLFLISKSKRPENMSPDMRSSFSLTKDGTPLALLKGLIALILFVNVLLQNLFPIYLSAWFYVQLIFRFVVFPLCMSMSRWYQLLVIFTLSKDQREKRLFFNKMCNYYMHFIGRLYLSNITTSGSGSTKFILVNFGASILEMLSVFSLKYRLSFLFELKQRLTKLYRKVSPARRTRIVSIASIDGRLDGFANQRNGYGNGDSKRNQYLDESFVFHSKQICDDISSEIFSIFLAPLQMYFLFSIFPNTPFQTISTISDCAVQIAVQLSFEFLGDVVCLAYQLRHGHIPQNIALNWKPLSGTFITYFSIFCAFYVHILVDLFS